MNLQKNRFIKYCTRIDKRQVRNMLFNLPDYSLIAAILPIIWAIYLKGISPQLYTWGIFGNNEVRIKTVFSKETFMIYEKCRGCGIAFYEHRALNSKLLRTRVYFIFLSYDAFNESFRSCINLWKPSKEKIKVKFSKALYEHLIEVLPKKQSLALRRDYERYML